MPRVISNDESLPRQEHAVASGALTDGTPVIVNSDGTVSVVAGSNVTEAFGTPVTITPALNFSAVYDPDEQKVIITYQDSNNSNYGTAIVGTVDASDNSISFGTAVVFYSNAVTDTSITYDTASDRIVIAFRGYNGSNYDGIGIIGNVTGSSISFGSSLLFTSSDSLYINSVYDVTNDKTVIVYRDATNDDGRAVVATVSDTTISYGSVVQFNTSRAIYIKAVYDANAQRVVVSYRDYGNSSYGTSKVGEVSGTSISFGSASVFNTASSNHIASVYDASNQKVVVCYQDGGNSDYGTAVVGTVDPSDNSISFGSEVVFESASTDNTSATYDSSLQKVVIAYRDGGNSNYGTAIVGNVSGTSITFDTPSVFEQATTTYTASAYDVNANRIVIAYRDGGNSNTGTAIVFRLASSSTNVTSENYIGITRSGVASGAGAIIDIQGAIADNLSGLTAGQSYFVQADGTLGTTAADPSVFAGTAVSATKLIVKG